MPDSAYILLIALATSALAFVAGRRAGLKPVDLPAALREALRCVGACMVFWALNVGLGAGIALLARWMGMGFVSLYVSTDLSILVLSAVQALVFELWRWRHAQGAATPP